MTINVPMSTAIDSHGRIYVDGCCESSENNSVPVSLGNIIGGELMSWSIIEIIGSGPAAELCNLARPERCESELDTRSSPGRSSPAPGTVVGHVSGLPDNSAGISTASPTLAVFEILGVLVRRCMKPGIMSTDVLFLSLVVRFLDADVGLSSVNEMVNDCSTCKSSESSMSGSS